MKCTSADIARLTRKRSRFFLNAAAIASAFSVASIASSAQADTAYTFGSNQYGELGDGLSANGGGAYNSSTPVLVNGLDSLVTVSAAGGAHSLFADNEALYSVGLNIYGMLGNGGTQNISNAAPGVVLTSGVTSLKAGLYFSMAIDNGAVYTWGPNIDAELGSGASTNGLSTVPALTGNSILNSGVTLISAGEADGLAVQNGALYSWGLNSAGQTGAGTYSPTVLVTTPTAVPVMTHGVTSISGGYNHSLGVMNGAAYAWGFNQNGQLGIGPNATTGPTTDAIYPTATAVVGLPSLPVSIVAAGGNHSLALVQGVVYAWGENESGELGNGNVGDYQDSSSTYGTPAAVMNISGFIINVQAGTRSSYALGADGSLWTWGDNTYGELGNSNTSGGAYFLPQHIFAPAGSVFTSIASDTASLHAVVTIGVAPSSWVPDASGNWNDSINWTMGVPNSVDAAVSFTDPPITATRTLTTTTPITVGNLSFDSASSYIIQGSGSITIQANLASSVRGAAINDYVGNHTVAPASLVFATSSNLNVSYGSVLTLGSPAGSVVIDSNTSVSETGYGTVAFTSMVSLQSGASLNLTTPTSINGLTLAANASTAVAAHGYYSDNLLQLGSLSLSSTSTLDLSNNEGIVHNGNLSAISSALSTGYNNGAWNGSGIVSSTAAADTTHLTALGSLQATGTMNVSGQSLVAGDVLLKYTYYGDANLDGKVDASDYSRIDAAFVMDQTRPGSATGWYNGDFNYDGVINGSDYTLIDNAFNTQGAQFTAQLATPTAEIAGSVAGSSVPEPTSIVFASVGLISLLGRRRKICSYMLDASGEAVLP